MPDLDTQTGTGDEPLTIDDAMRLLKMSPRAASSSGDASAPSAPDDGRMQRVREMPEFRALLSSLSSQESGGNAGAVAARTKASGIYQIMPSNIGPWGMDTVGRYVRRDEYMKDPELQRAIGEGKLAEFYADALDRTKGDPRLAAQRTFLQWYTGKPVAGANYKQRPAENEPSPKEYLGQTLKRFDRHLASPSDSTQQQTTYTAPAPEQQGQPTSLFPSAPPNDLFPSAPGATPQGGTGSLDAYVKDFDAKQGEQEQAQSRVQSAIQRISSLASRMLRPSHAPFGDEQAGEPPAMSITNDDLMKNTPSQIAANKDLQAPTGPVLREGGEPPSGLDVVADEARRTVVTTLSRLSNIFGIRSAVEDVTRTPEQEAILHDPEVPAIVRAGYAQALKEPDAPESSIGRNVSTLVGDFGRMGLEIALTKKFAPGLSLPAVGGIDAALNQIEPVATGQENLAQAGANTALGYAGFKGFEAAPALASVVSDVASPVGRKAAQMAIQAGMGSSLNLADAAVQGKMPEAMGPLVGGAQMAGLDAVGGDSMRAHDEAPLSDKAMERSAEIDAAAHQAATSPVNDTPEPTDAQKKAGNYAMGHTHIQGLDITIENPAGSERKGTAANGEPWSVTMQDHYGYIKRTEGADGDHVDTFIGPDPTSEKVFVVDQVDPKSGAFDEHKAIVGARSKLEATRIYKRNFSDDAAARMGAVTEMSMPQFKQWLGEGKRDLPVAGAPIEAEPATQTAAEPEVASEKEVATAAPVQERQPFAIASEGRKSYLRLANGEKKPVRYALVEAKDVKLSHDPFTFERNPEYAGENQNDYQADQAQQQVVIAGGHDLDTDIIHAGTTTAIEGPTIIDEYGHAAGGNGRGMMVSRAYEEKPSETKSMVIRDAQKFGLDPAAAAEMERPMIVRVQEDAVGVGAESNQNIAALNQTMTKQRATVSEGVYLAKQLSAEDRQRFGDSIANLDRLSDLEREPSRAEPVIRLLRERGQITAANQNEFVTGEGTLTERGRVMVEGAALGMALPDAQAIAKLPPSARERLSENTRPLAIAETTPGWELHGNIARVADYLDARRSYIERGGLKEAFDNQGSIAGDERPPLTSEDRTLLALLDDTRKTRFRDFMNAFALRVDDARRGMVDITGRMPTRAEAFGDAGNLGPSLEGPVRSLDAEGRVAPAVPSDAGAPLTPSTAVQQLSLDLGKRFHHEKIKTAAGAYDKRTGRINYRYMGDLDTLAHEVGHDVSFALSSNKVHDVVQKGRYDGELEKFWQHGSVTDETTLATKREEGVAEYVRAWIVNPIEAELRAPEFAREIEANVPATVLASLRSFGQEMQRHAAADPLARTLSNIQMDAPPAPTVSERMKGLLKGEGYHFQINGWDKMQAALRDALWPAIKGARTAAEMRSLKLKPEADPEMLFRDLVYGAAGKYEAIFDHGQVTPRNARYQETYTAEQLMDWVRGDTPDEIHADLNHAAALLVSERVIEKGNAFRRDARVKADDILHAADERSRAQSPDEARTTMEDAQKKADAVVRAAERQVERLSGAGAGMASDYTIAKQTIEQLKQDPDRYMRLREGARRYRVYADNNLQYMVDSGRLSQADYERIKADNAYYVDMHRVMEAIDKGLARPARGSLTAQGDVIKRFHGSTRQIDNPFVSLFEQTRKIYQEADRNRAMVSLRDLLDPKAQEFVPGLGEIGAKVAEGTPSAIKIWKDGKLEHWKFDDDVARSLNSLVAVSPTSLEKAFQFSAKVLRSGTVLSPAFNVAHRLRIMMQGAVSSGIDVKPWDYLRRVSKAERAEYYLAGGKVAGGYYESGASRYKDIVGRIITEQTGEGKLLSTFKNVADKVHSIYESSDLQPRLGDYRKARMYAKDVLGYDDYNASLYAAYRARDVLDFSISGHAVREINRYVPFFNAAIQGIAKNVRAARENPASFALKWSMYMLAPTMAEYGYNMAAGAGDDWRNLPSYQRDRYYNFKLPGFGWLKVPKPWELGVIASGVPRLIEAARGEPHPFDGYWRDLFEVMLPIRIEQLVQPVLVPAVLTGMINRDPFRDRPIVPEHEEGKALALRNTERSSRVGKWLGPMLGADPRQIDYAISAGFGSLGSLALAASDVGRADRPSFNLPRRVTGLSNQPSAWQSPDVLWVQKEAVRLGRENSREFRGLETQLKQANEATTDADRERLSREAVQTAKAMRRDYETNADDYLKRAVEKRVLRQQARDAGIAGGDASGSDITTLPVR